MSKSLTKSTQTRTVSQVEQKQVLELRKTGGFCLLDNYCLLEIKGPDAGKFLQSQTTNNVLSLEVGQGQASALVDNKAKIEALFAIYRTGNDNYAILSPLAQKETILSHIERFHFAEKFTTESLDSHLFWTAQGCLTQALLNQGWLTQKKSALLHPHEYRQLESGRLFQLSITGENGFILVVRKEQAQYLKDLEKEAISLGMTQLSKETLEIARIEAGIPLVGIDVGKDDLLPELQLKEDLVCYSKGCFIGQEVLARVRTYGSPRKGLMGLTFDNQNNSNTADESQNPSQDYPCLDDEIWLCPASADEPQIKIGTLKSLTFSPTLKSTIALCFLDREHRVPGKSLPVTFKNAQATKTNQHKYTVTPHLLPSYEPKQAQELAKTCYDQALQLFAQDKEDEAISQLRLALLIDPTHSDAYETLGVILARQDKLDEAIALMKQLSNMDPDSIMAHANLSVFYMRQGHKEMAEEEKAIAMSIRMSQAAKQFSQEQEKETSKKQKQMELESRLGMFKEVLNIDSEDLIANTGSGAVLVDLGKFAEAIPYLEKAIAIKPLHTVAYLALAKAFAALKEKNKALSTLETGMQVAAKKGDLMPMNEMQALKYELDNAK